jgi:hypothetical protein
VRIRIIWRMLTVIRGPEKLVNKTVRVERRSVFFLNDLSYFMSYWQSVSLWSPLARFFFCLDELTV